MTDAMHKSGAMVRKVSRMNHAMRSEASASGSLTDLPGCYVLLLHLVEAQPIQIGRLGLIEFPAGCHLYVGSAHGPGGLRGRLCHHLNPVTRPHWHVDYLRTVAPCMAVWYATGESANECAWAAALAQMPGAAIIAPRFGASDCGCAGHLLAFVQPPDASQWAVRAGIEHLRVLKVSAA